MANLRLGLDAVGVGSTVIANSIPAGAKAAPDVIDTTRFAPPLGLKLLWKAQKKLTGSDSVEHRLGVSIGQGLAAAHAQAPLDLFELEESFGVPAWVRGAIPAPMVVRLHGPWGLVAPALGLPDDAAFRQRVDNERRGLQAADAVTSPSRFALTGARAVFGLPLEGAAVIPNPLAAQPPPLRWTPETHDRRSVLFVGRFDRLKGADVVLLAFKELVAACPEAELVFVGPDRGLRDDAGTTWTFDRFIDAHLPPEARARVRMLGEQPAAALGELRRKAFVTMVASRFETFSMTVLEALAFGSPLVAPAAAAIVELVTDGEHALLYEDASPAAAARQLIRLFRDPSLAARLGAAGAEHVARTYGPEVVARQMHDLYRNVRQMPRPAR